MDFKTYQEESRKTAVYPEIGNNYIYPVLGLCGESGEVAEKVKKLIRDSGGVVTSEFITLISKEIGDCAWYLSAICSEFNLDFNDIVEQNIQKLKDRQNRNVIHGSGDLR